MPIDPNSIGQDRQYKDAVEADKAASGEYKDNVPADIPEDSKFATGNMPLQKQQSPFSLGPLGGGNGGASGGTNGE